MSQLSTSYKCTLLGDTWVGKTSLLNRIAFDKYREDIHCTIGSDFCVKKFIVNEKEIKLQIWDTVGGGRFRGAAPPNQYRGAAGFFLVYDITDGATFDSLPVWLREVWNYVDIQVPIIVLGNKTETENERQVLYKEAEEFAKENGFEFYEVSAKSSENVQKAFLRMAELIEEKVKAIWYKCVLMGEKDVGKSKLVSHLLSKSPKYKENTNMSRGQIYNKEYNINGRDMTLHISDTGGFFMASSSPYCRDLFGVILVYDITEYEKRESFVKIAKWLAEAREKYGKEVAIILVGNKIDLNEMRVVSYEEGEEFAKENGLTFFEAGQKDYESVEAVFLKMAELMNKDNENVEIQRNQGLALKLENKNQDSQSERCAC